ncbi:MAG: extracellular solute-binding protein, partial [Pseudomonadota bacterium]
MTLRTLFSTAALALALAGPVHADCAFSTEAEVRISSAAFEAWKAVNGAMQECGPNIQVEMSQEVAEKQPAGFAAQPSLYHIGGVFNSSLVPLVNAGSVRPLDDLVEKYGENLRPNQLITIDGQVMAIAMMVNAQHLMVRQDILDDLGLAVPTTYEELLEAAAVIAEADVVDYPFGAPWKTTWLAFVELYLGYGGAVFAEDGVTPALANETGMKTLDLMARIAEVMDPEYLVADATYVQQQLQQGRIAMAHQWASRAGALEDESESTVAGKMTMAAAPAPEAGMIPASSLWWDGIVIAQNVPDEEAEIAFQVAMEGLDAD